MLDAARGSIATITMATSQQNGNNDYCVSMLLGCQPASHEHEPMTNYICIVLELILNTAKLF